MRKTLTYLSWVPIRNSLASYATMELFLPFDPILQERRVRIVAQYLQIQLSMNSMKMDIMPRSECLISESLDFRKRNGNDFSRFRRCQFDLVQNCFNDVSCKMELVNSINKYIYWTDIFILDNDADISQQSIDSFN